MPLKINVNITNLDKIPMRFDDGQKWAANQAMMEMHEFIPKKEGYLRDSQTMSLDGKHISYHTPYARPQFYGLINGHEVQNYTTPGTGKRWDLRLTGDKEKMDNVKNSFIEGAKLRGSN